MAPRRDPSTESDPTTPPLSAEGSQSSSPCDPTDPADAAFWRREVRHSLECATLHPAHEADVAEELAQHLADRYTDHRRRGVAPPDALRATRDEWHRDPAGVTAIRDDQQHLERRPPAPGVLHASAAASWIAALIGDVRYALRTLRRHPTFAIVSVATLALGITGCVVMFAAVHGVLLRPLDFPGEDRLVAYWGTAPERGLDEVSLPDGIFVAHQGRLRTFDAVAAFDTRGFTLTGSCRVGIACDPERIDGVSVSLDFFRVLGVRPAIGRGFIPGEEVQGAAPVVVLSDALWRRRFGGDSAIVGRTVDLNGRARTVVGVMPPGFDVPNRAAVYTPLVLDPASFNCWCHATIGRLRAGVTAADARREIESVTDDFTLQHRDIFPDARRGNSRYVVMGLRERLIGNVEMPLVILFVAMLVTMTIACANIANLTLARATARLQEFAVRCSLGASPRRIAAQLLTEGAVLASAGAAVGLVASVWGVGALRALPTTQFPRIDEISINGPVIAFAAVVTVIVGAVCGITPSLRVMRLDVERIMRGGTRQTRSSGAKLASDAFVVGQFALSLILLVATGLLLRSYQRVLAVKPGFVAEGVLTARVGLPGTRYPTDTLASAFYGRLLSRIAALPGVQAVGTSQQIPLTQGNEQSDFVAEGVTPAAGAPQTVANVRHVSPGYFAAMGTPLVRGRLFRASDDAAAPHVAVVDETFAARYWPGLDAIGKRFRYGGDTSSARWITVVGIVPNVRHNRLDESLDLQVYEPAAQRVDWINYVVLRVTGSPTAFVPPLRRELAALDPLLPLYEVRTMSDAVRGSLGTRRLTSALLTSFAVLALVLAAIGIYGVMSVSSTAHTREFGIRLALGAQAHHVGMLVLRHGLVLAALGTAIGMLGAYMSGRVIRGLLFEVDAVDWITFAAVAGVLAITALIACWLPARRATRVDPMVALRGE